MAACGGDEGTGVDPKVTMQGALDVVEADIVGLTDHHDHLYGPVG